MWREPAGRWHDSRRCLYCGHFMAMNHPDRRPSRDHIFPREWGGTFAPENIRRVCQECNQLRALAGHCIAILACARAVAADLRRQHIGPPGRTNRSRAHYVLRGWRASLWVKPPPLPTINFSYPFSYDGWKALKREEIEALKRKHKKPTN